MAEPAASIPGLIGWARRKGLWYLLAFLPAATLLLVAWPRIDFFLLTGRFFPTEHVEHLQAPREVRGWTPEGLILADGSLVPLPGVSDLPADSKGLTQATRYGVEVTPSGRVIGLVRIWHWSGNDPVRLDLTRVDLAHLLMFLGEGRFHLPPASQPDFTGSKERGRFSKWGWNISEFVEFVAWSSRLEKNGDHPLVADDGGQKAKAAGVGRE